VSAHHSPRPWRDIARELARESDRRKRRDLMQELSNSYDPRSATCAICNGVCDLKTCKIDEQGNSVHEHCYTMRLKKATQNGHS
jgi:hypothetical protein